MYCLRFFFLVTLLSVFGPAFSYAAERTMTAATYPTHFSRDGKPAPAHVEETTTVRSAVITPVRFANIPAEVSGVIERINYEKGDFIEQGQVVVEISKKRHVLLVEMAQQKVKGLELAFQTGRQNLALKKEVYSKHYGTKQKLLEAETEVAAMTQKLEEATREVQLARINLQACAVKAPFSGYMVDRFREPYEAVNQLDKLFALADTARVYAVANVPEKLLPYFSKTSRGVFTDAAGRLFPGVVEKVEATLCPESKTSKVYVLILNSKWELKMGMTGELAKK